LHGVFPEVAERIIEDNSGFWARLIFEMKNLEGNKRELGLLVIELFLQKYETTFVTLDVIGNIKNWVTGAKNSQELLCYTRFLKACSRSKLLHATLLEEKVEFALLEKVERDYPNDVENFKAMLECYNANLISESELSQFISCQDGMKRTLLLSNSLTDESLDNENSIMDLLEKIYNIDSCFNELILNCLQEVLWVFSNIVEKRCFKWLSEWYQEIEDIAIWDHDYKRTEIINVRMNKLEAREKKIL
jgi:hypothetical protein